VVFPLGVLLIGGGFIAEGLWSVWSGHQHLSYLLQAWLPIAMAVVYVRTLVTGPAKVQREVQALLDELNVILDSTANFPDDRVYVG
jgi:hypothetical protein